MSRHLARWFRRGADDDSEEFLSLLASPWPSALIGGLILAGAIAFGHLLRDREAHALESATASAQETIANEVEARMLDNVGALERLAANWVRHGGLPQAEFEAEAGRLAQDYSFLQAIGWVDPDFRVRWIVPRAGNEAAEGLDLRFEARRRTALEASRDQRVIHISRPIQLVQGGLGVIGYAPLYVDGRFDGFVGGVWRADDLFSRLVGNLAPGFGVRISDDGEPIYSRNDLEAVWTLAVAADSLGPTTRPWSIEVAPLPAVVATYSTPLPFMVVAGGAGLGLGFAFMVQLARSRRIRNRQLQAEVRRREAVESDLSRVLEAIPDDVWRIEVTRDGIETLYYSEKVARIAGGTLDRFRSSSIHGTRGFTKTTLRISRVCIGI